MKSLKRTLIGLLSVGLALTTLGACSKDAEDTATQGSASQEQEVLEIKYGYIPDFNGASLLAVAEDQGLWEKHGLKAETLSFTNGPLQIQALGAGDLDFGYIGPGAMWLPASGQASVIAINGVGKADRVIAQPGINSIKDLKGKKVAIPEGTSGDMIVQIALEEAGMSMDDIEKVVMDASTVVSAFASGQVDAAGIWYPLIDTIKQQVPDLVELASNEDFADVMQFPNVMVAGAEPDEEKTTRVLKVLRDAMDWREANFEETIKLTAAMTQQDEEAVKKDSNNGTYYTSAELDDLTNDGTIDTWLTAMNKYFVQNGKVEGTEVAPSTYYKGDLFVGAGK